MFVSLPTLQNYIINLNKRHQSIYLQNICTNPVLFVRYLVPLLTFTHIHILVFMTALLWTLHYRGAVCRKGLCASCCLAAERLHCGTCTIIGLALKARASEGCMRRTHSILHYFECVISQNEPPFPVWGSVVLDHTIMII